MPLWNELYALAPELVHSPAFADAAHRQSLAVASSDQAHDDQAFVDAVSDRDDE